MRQALTISACILLGAALFGTGYQLGKHQQHSEDSSLNARPVSASVQGAKDYATWGPYTKTPQEAGWPGDGDGPMGHFKWAEVSDAERWRMWDERQEFLARKGQYRQQFTKSGQAPPPFLK